MDIWNIGLAEAGAELQRLRREFIQSLNGTLDRLSGAEMRIDYLPSPEGTPADLVRRLAACRESEARCRTSLIGPHRDRYEIASHDKKINGYSSGEKKRQLLQVYLAYVELFQSRIGQAPVFLLDDFDAAMDDENCRAIVERFPPMQVIATAVHAKEGFDELVSLAKEN